MQCVFCDVQAGGFGDRFPEGVRDFPPFETSRPTLGPIRPHSQYVSRTTREWRGWDEEITAQLPVVWAFITGAALRPLLLRAFMTSSVAILLNIADKCV